MNKKEFNKKVMEIINLSAGFLITRERHFLKKISSLAEELLEKGEEYFTDED